MKYKSRPADSDHFLKPLAIIKPETGNAFKLLLVEDQRSLTNQLGETFTMGAANKIWMHTFTTNFINGRILPEMLKYSQLDPPEYVLSL